jgi:hypothetical protein
MAATRVARGRVVVAGGVSAVIATAAALVPAAAQQPSRLRFAKPVTAIPAPLGAGRENTGEPRLQLLPSGRLLLSAQFEQWDCATRQPSTRLAMCVWASDDDGRHFHLTGGNPEAGDDADFAVAPDGSAVFVGMSDPSVGPVTLGTGLGGSNVFRSTDNGRSWTEIAQANTTAINDRPFLLATPHEVVMSFTAIPGDIQVVRSTDGGRTWSLPIQVTPQPPNFVIEANGGPAYDATRHMLLLPNATSADPTCTSGAGACINVVGLASSTDGGRTWSQEPIVTLPRGSGLNSMPQLTVDAAGHRYLTYPARVAGHDGVYVLDSPAPGHWSRPRRIDGQGSAIDQWTFTSGRGHLDVAYYRTGYADADGATHAWDFVVSDSRDGGRTWTTTTVARHVYTGTGSNHQLTLWDLVGITRDRHGQVVVAWTDDLGHAGGPTVVRVARSTQ